jgi:hypothetical protein
VINLSKSGGGFASSSKNYNETNDTTSLKNFNTPSKFGKGKDIINNNLRSKSIFEKIISSPSPGIIRNRIDININSPDFKNDFKSKKNYF